MSIRAMNWAWGVELPPAMKLVLLKLADRADDDGRCWPGMDSVAEACGVSRASVIRYLGKLEDMGLLTVVKRKGEDGRQLTNVYVLNLGAEPGVNLQPGDAEPGVNLQPGDAEPGCNGDDYRVALVQPDKELKLFIETTEETTDATTKVAAPVPVSRKVVEDPVQFDGLRWKIDDAVFDQWITAYANGRTAQDTEDWIEAEIAKASVWLQANPRKRKKNYLRFLTGWLTRASDSVKHRPWAGQPRPYH